MTEEQKNKLLELLSEMTAVIKKTEVTKPVPSVVKIEITELSGKTETISNIIAAIADIMKVSPKEARHLLSLLLVSGIPQVAYAKATALQRHFNEIGIITKLS